MLPTNANPNYTSKLVYSNKNVVYTALTIGDGKVMDKARKSGKTPDIINATKKILDNCIKSGVNVADTPFFEAEYLLLCVSMRDSGKEIEVNFDEITGEGDDVVTTKHSATIDLDALAPRLVGDKPNDTVRVDETWTIKLRYPSFGTMSDAIMGKEEDLEDALSVLCLESVYEHNGDKAMLFDDYSRADTVKYLDSLPKPVLDTMREWLETMPKLEHEVEFTNSFGKLEKKTLKGIGAFLS